MRTWIFKNLFLLPVLLIVLGLMLPGRLTAQTFTTLHSFTNGIDGAYPKTGFLLSGNTLYGTTVDGGSSGSGTVFAINTDGSGLSNLYSFSGGSDGAFPQAQLILSGNTLYGTAYQGGSSVVGTVFRVNTDSTGFTNLHSFSAGTGSLPYNYTNSDGALPIAGLLLSGNTLYGAANAGGTSASGTLFAVNTDGTGFTNLHSFTATSDSYPRTNSDGAGPAAGLILSGDTLYGTASYGGNWGVGTVFAVNTNGSGFTNIHIFAACEAPTYANSDGASPQAQLILSGNILYGTAIRGGSAGNGTVFAINTDGTGFTNLHSFIGGHDGPHAQLSLSGSILYGTAYQGGSSGNGTVFRVNTDGTGFTTLYSFTATSGSLPYKNSDGTFPNGLVLSNGRLYGTATQGGTSGYGTVFSLFVQPQLTIIPVGENMILAWSTNYSDFVLQSTTNLVSPVVWTTNSISPVVANGQNAVTNPISGTRQFYRLSR